MNWNGWRDTLDCLASLREQEYSNLQILVVDNGSTDDSVERIRSAFPEARLIETGKNIGFPSGCNVELRAALAGSAEFLWLLNNDTVCPPDTLRKLVRRAMASPEAGLVGTVLLHAHDPTKVQAWGEEGSSHGLRFPPISMHRRSLVRTAIRPSPVCWPAEKCLKKSGCSMKDFLCTVTTAICA